MMTMMMMMMIISADPNSRTTESISAGVMKKRITRSATRWSVWESMRERRGEGGDDAGELKKTIERDVNEDEKSKLPSHVFFSISRGGHQKSKAWPV